MLKQNDDAAVRALYQQLMDGWNKGCMAEISRKIGGSFTAVDSLRAKNAAKAPR